MTEPPEMLYDKRKDTISYNFELDRPKFTMQPEACSRSRRFTAPIELENPFTGLRKIYIVQSWEERNVWCWDEITEYYYAHNLLASGELISMAGI